MRLYRIRWGLTYLVTKDIIVTSKLVVFCPGRVVRNKTPNEFPRTYPHVERVALLPQASIKNHQSQCPECQP